MHKKPYVTVNWIDSLFGGFLGGFLYISKFLRIIEAKKKKKVFKN